MPNEFQNYTKQEVKDAIQRDIAQMKNENNFSLTALYLEAERRERVQQERIDHIPDGVSKKMLYRFSRKSELKKLKKHYSAILGSKDLRNINNKYIESLNKKRGKDNKLAIDVIEKEYLKNAFIRKDAITNNLFTNNLVVSDRLQKFSWIEAECKALLKAKNLDVNALQNRVHRIFAKLKEMGVDYNIFGSYKDALSNNQATNKLGNAHSKVLIMILRQGALQGAYNELNSQISNGNIDDINLKKVAEIHKELLVGNLLIQEFSKTSDFVYQEVENGEKKEPKLEEKKVEEKKKVEEEVKKEDIKKDEVKKDDVEKQVVEDKKNPEEKVEVVKKEENKIVKEVKVVKEAKAEEKKVEEVKKEENKQKPEEIKEEEKNVEGIKGEEKKEAEEVKKEENKQKPVEIKGEENDKVKEEKKKDDNKKIDEKINKDKVENPGKENKQNFEEAKEEENKQKPEEIKKEEAVEVKKEEKNVEGIKKEENKQKPVEAKENKQTNEKNIINNVRVLGLRNIDGLKSWEEQENDRIIADKKKADAKAAEKRKRDEAEKFAEELKNKDRDNIIRKIEAKYPIPENASADEKMHIAYDRMAALLGIEESCQLPEKTEGYMDMAQVRTEYDKISKEKDVNSFWSPELVEKKVNIQTLDRLFGVQRERIDYKVKLLQKDRPGQAEKAAVDFVYQDITAKKMEASQYFRSDLKKERVNRGMNIELATKLFNLNINDYRGLFKNLSYNDFTMLKNKIDEVKKDINDKKLVLFRKDLYKVNYNLNLIDDVMSSDCTFYTYNSDVDRTLGDERVIAPVKRINRPGKTKEAELFNWLELNENNKDIEGFAPVYAALEAYFKEVKEGNWLKESYYKAFEEMSKAVSKWNAKQNKTEKEEEACKSLTNHYLAIYGANWLGDSTTSLEDEIKKCEEEDGLAAEYLSIKLKKEEAKALKALDNYEYEGTAEEQKQKKKDDEEQIKNNFSTYREKMILDKTDVPLFPHDPCIEDVILGNLMDDRLLAPITAIVKKGSGQISSMMKDYGKVVKVTFDKNHTVYVSKKIAGYYSAKNSLWVQIMEKAYAKAFKTKDQKVAYPTTEIDELIPYVKNQRKPKAFLKEAYFKTPLWIRDVQSKDAFNNLLGYTKTEELSQFYALNDSAFLSGDVFKKFWKSAVDTEKNEDAMKVFIREYIEDALFIELKYRMFAEESKTYRAVTVEDIRDTLMDIKNWKHQDKRGNVYYQLLKDLKYAFPGMKTDNNVMRWIKKIGQDLMEAGLKQDKDIDYIFGYRANLLSDKVYYTKQAEEWYRLMENAIGKYLPVTVHSKMFGNVFSNAGELEELNAAKNGVPQGFAFTVTRVYQENNHCYVSLRNPLGRATTEYRLKRNSKDEEEVTIGMLYEKDVDSTTGGEFTLELNDFMNSFDKVTMVNDLEVHERTMQELNKQEGRKHRKI